VYDLDDPQAKKQELPVREKALADFCYYDAGVRRLLPTVWIEGNIYCGYLRSKKALREKIAHCNRECTKD
jgi:hypothetical protein